MASGTAHELTREQARRIAVRAQLLSADRPTDVLDVVRHLGFLQVDLTRVVAEHADLALWTRLGSAYEPEDLEELDERTCGPARTSPSSPATWRCGRVSRR